MNNMMIKMAADFLKIKPDDILDSFERVKVLVESGIETLEQIDKRLSTIEKKLEIERENDA